MKLPKPRKRGSAYQIELMYEGRRYSATRDTAKQCEQWAAEKLLQLKAGTHVDKRETLTFRELVHYYYEQHGKFTPSAKQINEKVQSFDSNFGQLGEKQIHLITPQDLTEWRNRRQKQVSDGTVLKEISLFSAIFTYAKTELFLLDKNPWFDISKPSQPENRHRRIKQDEIERLIEAAQFRADVPPKQTRQYVVLVFLLAIETALRRNEILSITPDNIFDKYVYIPKSKNGVKRHVPLSAFAKQLLSIMPFNVCSENAFKKSWQRLLLSAGIEDLHFHDTRHEAISRMVHERKLPVEVLAKITGHKRIQTLVNTYYNPTADEIVSMFNAN